MYIYTFTYMYNLYVTYTFDWFLMKGQQGDNLI